MLEMYSRTQIKSDGPIAIMTFSFMEGYFREKVRSRPLVLAPAVLVLSQVFRARPGSVSPESAILESDNFG